MVLCGHCTRDCPETIDPKFGSVCCGVCGKVCRDNVFIDGDDVKGYLNTKQEYLYKKIIWEAMNKDYLQEQAEKERYGRSKKSMDKRRRQQRNKRDTNANAATAAAEATTEETRTKKRLSSKINYNALDTLFDEEDPFVVPSVKRTRVESRNDSDDEDKNEAGTKNNDDDEEQENGDVEEMVDDKYEADTENCNGDEEEQENGDGEEAVDEEEEDTEEWYSRNEEEECDYGYDDEGDDECW